MPTVFAEQVVLEFVGVGQVAVVGKRDTVRRIDVKGLRLGRRGTARRRVAHMRDTHVAGQIDHVLVVEHVARQTVGLAQIQATFVAGHDARRVLAAMLQHQQGVIQRLVDR